VIITLTVTGWTLYARLVRGEALGVKTRDFVIAARAAGAGDGRIMLRHVLPNVLTPVIVVAVFAVANMIILEATLSFLGLGVPPPTPTWGGMLSDSLAFYQVAWWFPLFPGLALLATTLAFNLLGDGVRDALDPTAGRAGGGGDR
jgi:peptide/nickel transport system permease protein